MKKQNYLASFLPWQSEFDRHFACWANNHNGWSKMKKMNKRLAKKRERRQLRREIGQWVFQMKGTDKSGTAGIHRADERTDKERRPEP